MSNPDRSTRPNPFVLPDRATIDAATARLNGACEPWGHDTAGSTSRRSAKRLIKRTGLTRYIVLGYDPLRAREREYVTVAEAFSIVGDERRLVNAVANGIVPIVIAAGADFTFRRQDLQAVRSMESVLAEMVALKARIDAGRG